MNNDVINISPISYTNKDFRAVYEELLNLTEDLTGRWDPRSTNESDPGLVLLKLKAFIADKLNYNLDKNALENFPSQATQRGNAQKSYDLLGYNMKYYKSATTSVVLKYQKIDEDVVFEGNTYEIPAFTQLTDDSNTINYVTLVPATIPTEASNRSYPTIEVIEGIIQDLSINGNTSITVDNLDSDYRLYFSESMVAQNGIFIYNKNELNVPWTAVDNLEATQLGQKVFKFGVAPNTNTCYLEFPQDAASLFESGINIKYVITSGVEGNISAGTLSTIANDIVIKDSKNKEVNLKNCTLISQPRSATNGENPETLQEAYRNCKKTINTFNTLVTLKDYENALFNSGEVSNCVVSDRTNDIQDSYKVISKDSNGNSIVYLNELDGKGIPKMNAFNIAIYALNSVNSIDDESSYNLSFQTSKDTISNAQYAISNYKSIQHDYIDTIPNSDSDDEQSRKFIYKNLVSLRGRILTYQKVTQVEAKEIQQNVNKKLYQNYNSRKIDFGQELNYYNLIEDIKSADDRIKEIILDYPEYSCCLMNSNNNLIEIPSSIEELNSLAPGPKDNVIDILVKSILAGVSPYFIFDNNNVVDFTMAPAKKIESVVKNANDTITQVSFTTDDNMTLEKSTFEGIAAITTNTVLSSGVTLLPNENVFCVGPSFVSKAKLSTCLYYAILSTRTDTQGRPFTLKANNYYVLGEDEYLIVAEGITKEGNLDLSGSKKYWVYSGYSNFKSKGNIILPTMDITFKNINFEGDITNAKIEVTSSENLGTNNSIEVFGENSVQINAANKIIYAAWSCDNLYNQLFDINKIEQATEDIDGKTKTYYKITKLLQNNDIFIYTDENMQDLVILGSGTELTITSENSNALYLFKYHSNLPWTMPKLNLTSLNNNGLSTSIKWNEIPVSIKFLTAEKQIMTLGEGTELQWDDNNKKITNTPTPLTNFKYRYKGEAQSSSLPEIIGGDASSNWSIFSRLSLTVTPTKGQLLIGENGKRLQSVIMYKLNDNKEYEYLKDSNDITTSTLSQNHYITSNNIVALSGGVKQNTITLTPEGDFEYNLNLYAAGREVGVESNVDAFNVALDSTTTNTNISDIKISDFKDYIQIALNAGKDTPKDESGNDTDYKCTFNLNLSPRFENSLIPILATSNDGSCTFEIISGDTNIILTDEGSGDTSTVDAKVNIDLTTPYLNYIKIETASNSNVGAIPLKLSISNIAPEKSIAINIYNPLKIKQENEFLNIEDRNGKSIKELVKEKSTPIKDENGNGMSLFDYSYQIDEEDIIDNPLSPESFFNPNHIYNKYVISQLNTRNSNISIATQSLQSRRL